MKTSYKNILFLAAFFGGNSFAGQPDLKTPTPEELENGKCAHGKCKKERKEKNVASFGSYKRSIENFDHDLLVWKNRPRALRKILFTILPAAFAFAAAHKNSDNPPLVAFICGAIGFGSEWCLNQILKPRLPWFGPSYDRNCLVGDQLDDLADFQFASTSYKVNFWRTVSALDHFSLISALRSEFRTASFPLIKAFESLSNFEHRLTRTRNSASDVMQFFADEPNNPEYLKAQRIFSECEILLVSLTRMQFSISSSREYLLELENKRLQEERRRIEEERVKLEQERVARERQELEAILAEQQRMEREVRQREADRLAAQNRERARVAELEAQRRRQGAQQQQINDDRKLAEEIQAAQEHEVWLDQQKATMSELERKKQQIQADAELAKSEREKEQQAAELAYWNRQKVARDAEPLPALPPVSAPPMPQEQSSTQEKVYGLDDNCQICLDSLDSGLRKTCCCNRIYHKDCVRSLDKCPNCRKQNFRHTPFSK